MQKKTATEFKTKSLISLNDSIYEWRWDTLSDGWNPFNKTIDITYDVNNNYTGETDQRWNGTAWINSWQYTYTFDIHNNQISEIDQIWKDAVL